MTGALRLTRDDALGPDTLAMIAESEAELAGIYPPEVRFAFSPDELRGAGVIMLVAHRGATPVGCGGLAPCAGYGELKRIFVTQSARGTGVVQAILAGLEAEASALGLHRIKLETGTRSPEAIRAYEKCGYRRRGPFGPYVENGSSVFMEKAL
ncbi:MAG: GNAT family N-acetyltransferase [Pseudomonadota bacterium]